VAVGESWLRFFAGARPWSEEANRSFMRALYGLVLVHFHQGSWNTSEQLLFVLLYLDPCDELGAGALLARVRLAVGLCPLAG
jgi:hypothetical protein